MKACFIVLQLLEDGIKLHRLIFLRPDDHKLRDSSLEVYFRRFIFTELNGSLEITDELDSIELDLTVNRIKIPNEGPLSKE
jgi:hypothetical protein